MCDAEQKAIQFLSCLKCNLVCRFLHISMILVKELNKYTHTHSYTFLHTHTHSYTLMHIITHSYTLILTSLLFLLPNSSDDSLMSNSKALTNTYKTSMYYRYSFVSICKQKRIAISLTKDIRIYHEYIGTNLGFTINDVLF